MRKLLIGLLLLFLCFTPSNAAIIMKAGTIAGESFIHTNGLETQADGDDWATVAGTPDYDYSAAPLVGLESLALDPTEEAKIGLTAADEVYISLAVKWSDDLENAEICFSIRNVSDVLLARFNFTDANAMKCLAGETGTLSDAGATSGIGEGTTSFIMLYYKKGTGANSEARAWYWNGAAWVSEIASTDGDATTQTSYINIDNNADTEILYIDQIKEKSTSVVDPT